MKILHLIPSLNPELGGPTLVVLNLAREQLSLGHDVEIATTNDHGVGVQPFPVGEVVDYEGVPVRFFERFFLRRNEFIPSWPMLRWLKSNVASYDLLHLHYLFTFTSTVASWAARRSGVPYIVRPLGQLSPWALKQGSLHKSIYSTLFERKMLNEAAAIHATTVGEADDVKKFGVTSKIEIVPLGIEMPQEVPFARELAAARWEVSREGVMLLFLSRIHPKKRLDLLLRAMAALVADYGDAIQLVIAGKGEAEYERELKQLAAGLGISPVVTWVGFVSGEDKDIVLRAADIFVLPSFSENFGVAVGEALACGKPVVITEGVQISDEVKSAGAGIVIGNTVDDLVEAISTLTADEQLRCAMGENGMELVQQHYSWSHSASLLSEIYQRAIQK